MKSKSGKIIVGIGLLLLSILFVGWYTLSPLKPFYSKEELINKINEQYEEFKVAEILEIYFLDENHVFAPFMTEEGEYGMSLWERKRNLWHRGQILLNFSVMKWEIDSTDYFIWNVPLRNEAIKLNLYLLKGRQYSVSEGDIYYSPAIQMKDEISMDSKGFGYRKVNEKWNAVKDEFNDLNERLMPLLNYEYDDIPYYGYDLKNKKDEEFPIQFFSSEEFDGEVSFNVDYVSFITDQELQ